MNALRLTVEAIADILYQILLQIREATGHFGLAIVLLTVFVKVILHPLIRRQVKSIETQRRLASRISALRERFKDDPHQLAVELARLYREHGVRPAAALLQTLFQLPILAGLWALFRRRNVFVPLREQAADRILGIPLDATPNLQAILLHPALLVVPFIVALTTYWQQYASSLDPNQTWLLLILALAAGYFAMQFPVGMSLYWITSSVLSVVERFVVLRPSTGAPLGPTVFTQRPRHSKKRQT